MQPIGGRNRLLPLNTLTLIDDCYNANPISMKSSIDLLNLAQGEKIAILGDMFELGENERQLHKTVGTYAVQNGIKRLYLAGDLSRDTMEGAAEAMDNQSEGSQVILRWWSKKQELLDALRQDFGEKRELLPVGATVLIKASHGMHFEEVTALLQSLDEPS